MIERVGGKEARVQLLESLKEIRQTAKFNIVGQKDIISELSAELREYKKKDQEVFASTLAVIRQSIVDADLEQKIQEQLMVETFALIHILEEKLKLGL